MPKILTPATFLECSPGAAGNTHVLPLAISSVLLQQSTPTQNWFFMVIEDQGILRESPTSFKLNDCLQQSTPTIPLNQTLASNILNKNKKAKRILGSLGASILILLVFLPGKMRFFEFLSLQPTGQVCRSSRCFGRHGWCWLLPGESVRMAEKRSLEEIS